MKTLQGIPNDEGAKPQEDPTALRKKTGRETAVSRRLINLVYDSPQSCLIHSESPVVLLVFERRLISGGCNEKPVKKMIAELTPVEFVTELVQVLLNEHPPHAVIDVSKACLGVGYGVDGLRFGIMDDSHLDMPDLFQLGAVQPPCSRPSQAPCTSPGCLRRASAACLSLPPCAPW